MAAHDYSCTLVKALYRTPWSQPFDHALHWELITRLYLDMEWDTFITLSGILTCFDLEIERFMRFSISHWMVSLLQLAWLDQLALLRAQGWWDSGNGYRVNSNWRLFNWIKGLRVNYLISIWNWRIWICYDPCLHLWLCYLCSCLPCLCLSYLWCIDAKLRIRASRGNAWMKNNIWCNLLRLFARVWVGYIGDTRFLHILACGGLYIVLVGARSRGSISISLFY